MPLNRCLLSFMGHLPQGGLLPVQEPGAGLLGWEMRLMWIKEALFPVHVVRVYPAPMSMPMFAFPLTTERDWSGYAAMQEGRRLPSIAWRFCRTTGCSIGSSAAGAMGQRISFLNRLS